MTFQYTDSEHAACLVAAAELEQAQTRIAELEADNLRLRKAAEIEGVARAVLSSAPWKDYLRRVESFYFHRLYHESRGKYREAVQLSGLSRATIRRKWETYGIT